MSWEAVAWATMQKTGDPARKVLLLLANCHNPADGRIFPSQAHLADRGEMSERTVRRRLGELERRGIIRRHGRKNGRGYRATDAYELVGFCTVPNTTTREGEQDSPPCGAQNPSQDDNLLPEKKKIQPAKLTGRNSSNRPNGAHSNRTRVAGQDEPKDINLKLTPLTPLAGAGSGDIEPEGFAEF